MFKLFNRLQKSRELAKLTYCNVRNIKYETKYCNMLTKAKALEFLENSWKMNNVELQVQEDREKFLNKLIVTIVEKVPFQFLFLLTIASMPPNERKVPNLDEIDEMCMSGMGGNCSMINLFTSRLLKALGYSAYVCRVTATSSMVIPHVIAIVKDLVNTGDLHLVDCGSGQPSFRAVSLNFHEESPIYQDSYLEYKFIKHDGKFLRMHGNGDLIKRNNPRKDFDFIIGKWRRFYEFTIETLECETHDDLGPNFSFQFLPVLEPRAARFPGGKTVMILKGNILYIEQEDKTLKPITLKSNEEIFQAFKDYFPSIKEDLVRLAYSTWQKSH